jgi:hypothetical protein
MTESGAEKYLLHLAADNLLKLRVGARAGPGHTEWGGALTCRYLPTADLRSARHNRRNLRVVYMREFSVGAMLESGQMRALAVKYDVPPKAPIYVKIMRILREFPHGIKVDILMRVVGSHSSLERFYEYLQRRPEFRIARPEFKFTNAMTVSLTPNGFPKNAMTVSLTPNGFLKDEKLRRRFEKEKKAKDKKAGERRARTIRRKKRAAKKRARTKG